MRQLSLLVLVLLSGACGGDDDDVAPAADAGNADSQPAPDGATATLSGVVARDFAGAPLADVMVQGAGRSTTTAADGSFELTLPVGPVDVAFSKAGFWTHNETLDASQPPGQILVISDDVITNMAASLALTLDPQKAIVLVFFDQAVASGGTASLDGTSDGPYFMREPSGLSAGSNGTARRLIFFNVDPGATTVTIGGGATCSVSPIGSLPLSGHNMAVLQGTCQ